MNEQREYLLKTVDKAILEAIPLWPLIGLNAVNYFLTGRDYRSLRMILKKPPKVIIFGIPGTNVRYKVCDYEEILGLFKKEIKRNWRKENDS